MAWFNKDKPPKVPKDTKLRIPEGLWVKCNNCREVIYTKEMEKNCKVCPKCDYHFPISVEERISLILDEGSFKEWDRDLISVDPLNFRDTSRYRDRLRSSQEKSSFKEAVTAGQGTIQSRHVDFGVFNFNFMGGSMGSVVGEKILRATERAAEHRHPLILVISSGGARMQEGILSLMQMAKTSAAVARLHEVRAPLITILTDPTYGGVTASFAMLGDIIIAEPRSLIGFAGPRVIEETIKQQLPSGFQRAEFLLEHGFIDLIVPRKQLKDTLAKLIAFF
jgi:acetyl-CoA carboxylase carboxyl transferase subunit beta